MAHYCPKCFNASISIQAKGVVQVLVNGLKMDRGKFLFNAEKDSLKDIEKELHKKLDEFFKWYSDFQNPRPIEKVNIISSDVECQSGCRLPIGSTFSVVGMLVKEAQLKIFLKQLGDKYKMQIQLAEEA